jgi:hypothetical protein
MIKHILVGLTTLFLLTGCKGCTEDRVEADQKPTTAPIATNVPTPVNTLSPTEQNIEALKKKLDEADKRAAEAAAKGETITKLSAEKDSLGLRVQLAEAYAKEWKQNAESYAEQKTEKEKELKDAKIDAWKEKLWWMAGICGLLAIVAGGICIAFPLLRPVAKYASGGMAAIAVLMLIVAQSLATVAWLLGFVPYIIGLAILAGLVYLVVALRHWYKDHHGLQQTVTGIEPLKESIEGFSDHMLKYVDGPLVDHVKGIRTKLGLRADKEKEALKKELAAAKKALGKI